MRFPILFIFVIPTSYSECPERIIVKFKADKERMNSLSSQVDAFQRDLAKSIEIETAALYLIGRTKSDSFPISLAELPSEVSLEAVQGLILDPSRHPETVADEYGALRLHYWRELSEASSKLATATRDFFDEKKRVVEVLFNTLEVLDFQLEAVKTELRFVESKIRTIESKKPSLMKFVDFIVEDVVIEEAIVSVDQGFLEQVSERLHSLVTDLLLAARENEFAIIHEIKQSSGDLFSPLTPDSLVEVVAHALSEVAEKNQETFAADVKRLESYEQLLLQDKLKYDHCKHLLDL
jgi:hypothetical protein